MNAIARRAPWIAGLVLTTSCSDIRREDCAEDAQCVLLFGGEHICTAQGWCEVQADCAGDEVIDFAGPITGQTTWSCEPGYRVADDLEIEPGASLTIIGGVEVEVQGAILVDGTLETIGVGADKVRLRTAPGDSHDGSLVVREGSATLANTELRTNSPAGDVAPPTILVRGSLAVIEGAQIWVGEGATGVMVDGTSANATFSRSTITGNSESTNGVRVVEGEVSVSGMVLQRHPRSALVLEAGAIPMHFDGNTFSGGGASVLTVAASVVEPLISVTKIPNRFPMGAVVAVEGGQLTESATWAPLEPGLPYQLDESLCVGGSGDESATLTLTGGTELQFARDAELVVGQNRCDTDAPTIDIAGGLQVDGSEDERVTMRARRDSSWPGLSLYGAERASISGLLLEGVEAREDGAGALTLKNTAQFDISESEFKKNTAPHVLVTLEQDLDQATRSFEGRLQGLEESEEPLVVLDLTALDRLTGNLEIDGEGAVEIRTGIEAGDDRTVDDAMVMSETTWSLTGAPLHFDAGIAVGAELTIEEGVELLLPEGSGIEVGDGGSFVAAQVTLGATSGQWNGLSLTCKHESAQLNEVKFAACGNGQEKYCFEAEGTLPTVVGSTFPSGGDNAVVRLANVGADDCDAVERRFANDNVSASGAIDAGDCQGDCPSETGRHGRGRSGSWSP